MISKATIGDFFASPFWLTLVALALVFAQNSFAEVSLQKVYDEAIPGEGYDKLLELDPQEVYVGDLAITGSHTVCIHGNGSLVAGKEKAYAIKVYGALLDIDHVVIEANIVGIFYGVLSSGTVKNNTIVGAKLYGLQSGDISMAQGLEIFNNIIVNNSYGIYCNEGYIPEYIAYNDLWNNPKGDYIKYCEG